MKAFLIFFFFSISAIAIQSPLLLNQKVGSSIKHGFSDRISKVDIIVILKNQTDTQSARNIRDRSQRVQYVYESLKRTANMNQGPLTDLLEKKGLSYKRFLIMNMVSVESVSVSDIQEITLLPSVARVILNPKIKDKPLPKEFDSEVSIRKSAGQFTNVVENIFSTQAPKIWNLTQGQGIVVSGQDTGVQWDHPALIQSYRGNKNGKISHDYNWFDSIKTTINPEGNKCGKNLSIPCDDDGHGTHTLGTIVGDDGDKNKIGMAPKSQWIACRNMDGGMGRPTTYISCFEFFLAPHKQNENAFENGRPELAPHVINNSWGCPESENCEGDEFLPILSALKDAGIMVVVSAGNEGSECSTIQDPPAHHTGFSLVVGAHNHRNTEIARFSSRGPSLFDGGIGPDVTAPGVSVTSSVPGNGYEGLMWSGTSMAGPHVAGLVALMWSANRSLIGNIDKTIEIIKNTTTKKTHSQNCGGVSGTNIPNNVFGYGMIDAQKAVLEAMRAH